MSDIFLGEVRLFGFNFVPKGWALANGQLFPINQNQALFALLGTAYGGDGQTNFALPNLQGKVPIHFDNFPLATSGGEQVHTLTQSEMPMHVHALSAATSNADNINPGSNMFAAFNAGYTPAANLVAITPSTVGATGGSQAHENRQPYLVITYGIALLGIFPSRN